MKKLVVCWLLIAASGSVFAEYDFGAALQKSWDKALVKNGFKPAGEQGAKGDGQGGQTAPSSASGGSTVAAGEMVGKVVGNPHEDMSKKFKIARGIQFGGMEHPVVAFDLSNKAGRRVVVMKQQSTDHWLITGDIAITAKTPGLALVGTADEDDSGEGDPQTICTSGGKVVQAFGFLKASKKRFDQPAGGLAWAVDKSGTPMAVTGLTCKF